MTLANSIWASAIKPCCAYSIGEPAVARSKKQSKSLDVPSGSMASSRQSMGSRHSKQPEHSPAVAATVIANATAASAASKAAKLSKGCLPGLDDVVTTASTAEELLEQCKCPISLELMRRPVLPSSGQAFDEINLKRWATSGNTKCPVSGQELRMHKDKVQYTKHHLLRNIIRQQAAKAKMYIPPTDKEQLLLELQKPSRLVKALQALFDDRCLSYVKKDVMMGVLKDLVKSNKAISKAQNKAVPDAEGRSFNLLQMIIRCCLAARKDDLIKYGRKLLKSEANLWRDPEIIAEILGLAEDTEHRGNILSDIEAKFSETKVGPKEFVRAVLRHHSDKNPVQRCLDKAANEVLAFRTGAYDSNDWSTKDKGELLNMALAAVHLQCIDAGICYAQTGMGVTRWTKALADLQGLGCILSRSNMEALFRSPVHSMALQQMSSGSGRTVLEWHMEQHDSSLIGALCLDHIALPPQPGHSMMNTHIDFASDDPSTDGEMDDDGLEDEDIIMARRRALLPHNSMGRYLNIPAAIPYSDQDDGDDDDEDDDEEDDGEDDGEDEEGDPLPGHGIGLDGSIELPPQFIGAYNYPGDAVHDRPTQRRRVR